MKILVVTQYFWPENFIINDLALSLQQKGYTITVLTGKPNYPQGKMFKGYSFFGRVKESYKNIEVIRVPLIPRGKGGKVALTFNYFSFVLSSIILGPIYCRGKYDLIFTFETSPVTVGLPAIIMKKIKKAPHLFWVQDLWPASLSATGAIKNKLILNLVDILARYIYKHCEMILVQSEKFFDYITAQGINREKIVYFPNWANAIFEETDNTVISGHGVELPEGFKIVYAGNIGAAQGFNAILEAALILKSNYNDLKWIIIGEGRLAGWAKKFVIDKDLIDTVYFLGRKPLEMMPAYYAKADVVLVSLKSEPTFSMTVPSKIQSYMAFGCPIVAALDGVGAELIDAAGCGFVCKAEDSQALANAIEKMYFMNSEQRRKMGSQGKIFYQEHFKRDKLISQLDYLIAEAVGSFKS